MAQAEQATQAGKAAPSAPAQAAPGNGQAAPAQAGQAGQAELVFQPLRNAKANPESGEAVWTEAENVRYRIEGSILLLAINLSHNGGKSESGKSVTVATTKGNMVVPGTGGAKLGVNLYRAVKA